MVESKTIRFFQTFLKQRKPAKSRSNCEINLSVFSFVLLSQIQNMNCVLAICLHGATAGTTIILRHFSCSPLTDIPFKHRFTQTTVEYVFHKGEHKKCFAYEAHTACDKNNFILAVDATAGNVHDRAAFDSLYEEICKYYHEHETTAASLR